MIKSIYEEAIERIDVEFDAWDRAEHLELFELIELALEQAQKQEKLLELYRKLLKLEHDDFNELYKGNSEEYFKEWNKTFEQIKELENES